MKRKDKVIISIVLLLLCASLIVAVIVKKKDNDKEETKEEITTEKSTSSSYDSTTLPDDEIAKELMERVQDYDLLDAFNVEGELSNQQKLAYAFYILNYDYETDIPADDVKIAINKYFNTEYTNEDFNCLICDKRLYKYDAVSNKYVYDTEHDNHGVENLVAYNTIERYDSHNVDNNVYTITVYKAFTEVGLPTALPHAYYSKYSGGAKLFEIEYDLTKEKTDVMGEFRKVESDKLTKVTYTFTKNSEGILVLKDRVATS